MGERRAEESAPERAIERVQPAIGQGAFGSVLRRSKGEGVVVPPAPNSGQAAPTRTGVGDGAEDAAAISSESLVTILYDELRAMAHRKMARIPPGQTLQATALLHEAYLRLSRRSDHRWGSREDFFRAAAHTMRCVIVDTARERNALKRGGGRRRESLTRCPVFQAPLDLDVIALAEALERLRVVDPQLADIVDLRFFAGLTAKETAAALDLSERTVVRGWRCARAWLYAELSPDTPGTGSP